MVHFHSSDERFCGSTERFRAFSFDPNEVTCKACQESDTLELTPQGQAFLDSLDAALAQRTAAGA